MSGVGRLLVVEDEPDVRDVLVAYLRRDGHLVEATGDGAQAWTVFQAAVPDLVLLDVRLPGLDGFELLARIRRHSAVPVIMVTARDEDLDKVLGLRMGADDYVVKPFNPAEVTARVATVLRRVAGATVQHLAFGPLTVDVHATQARVHGTPVPLTVSEYRLLVHLATNPRRTITREQLRAAALPESTALDRVVDAHLTNLRRKLADAGLAHDPVETVRGIGYRFAPLAPGPG